MGVWSATVLIAAPRDRGERIAAALRSPTRLVICADSAATARAALAVLIADLIVVDDAVDGRDELLGHLATDLAQRDVRVVRIGSDDGFDALIARVRRLTRRR